MKHPQTRYYAGWVRWQQQNGFLLWQNPPEPAREAVWADEQRAIPLFKTLPALAAFARRRGYALAAEPPQPTNLDAVAE